jgi:hypothetical protein
VRRRDVICALAAGLVATVPFQVCAQRAMPTVGVVSPASSATSRFAWLFLPQMKEFGWEDGRNCTGLEDGHRPGSWRREASHLPEVNL